MMGCGGMNKKIKICHYIYAINGGGVENLLFTYFSQDIMRKYCVSIITQEILDHELKDKLVSIGIDIYLVPRRTESFFENFKRSIKIIKKIKPDIMHVHLTDANWIPLMYAKMEGVRIRISHSHNVFYYSGLKKLRMSIFRKLGLHYATDLIGCSQCACDFLFGKTQKCTIVKNAINLDLYRYNNDVRRELRRNYNIDNNIFVIGCVGRLTEQKNQLFIIDILNYLVNIKNKEDVFCCLIGDGIQKIDIINRIEMYHLEKNTLLLGQINDVNKYMSMMDVIVAPSKYEGLGISNVEAQAAGLKVVASNRVPIEVNITGNMKFLSLNEKISVWGDVIYNTRVKNREQISNISINQLEEVGYSIEKASLRLDQIYKECLSRYEV